MSDHISMMDVVVPADRQAVMNEIDIAYQQLIARVDNHIDRLTVLENALTAELEQSETDWLDQLETQSEGRDDQHVHFDERVLEIDSDNTVEPMFTPFGAYMNSDSDSDTETVVLDYDDPTMSPDIRFVIRHPIRADADTDSDDDFY